MNVCSICSHELKGKIERAILAREPLRQIAAWSGTSKGALLRHKPHMSKAIARVAEAQVVAAAGQLVRDIGTQEGRADTLYLAAQSILAKAMEAKDLRTALQAINAASNVLDKARRYLELRGEIGGELRANKGPVFPNAQIIWTTGEAVAPAPALADGAPLLGPPETILEGDPDQGEEPDGTKPANP